VLFDTERIEGRRALTSPAACDLRMVPASSHPRGGLPWRATLTGAINPAVDSPTMPSDNCSITEAGSFRAQPGSKKLGA
jgi:hypothetical protein